MSLQRQFEGPDVRALLDEIQATYGPDPTIARAETFRTGGVLGFFQREHYRLVIDEASQPRPSAPARPAAVAPAGGATGNDDPFAFLADATLDDTVVGTGQPSPAAVPSAPAPTAADRQPTFEAVLHQVGRLVDPPTVPPAAPPASSAADLSDASLGLYRPPAVGTPQAYTGRPHAEQAYTDLLASAAAAASAPEPPADPPSPTAPALPVAAHAPHPATRDALPAVPAPTAGSRIPGPGSAPRTGRGPGSRRSPLGRRLTRMGLHRDDVSRVERAVAAGHPVEAALLKAMDAYPVPPRPPRRAGSLVVVIGPGMRAFGEATRIAGEVGTDPATVAVATERRPVRPIPDEVLLHGADDALEVGPGLRRGRVGVVAVDTSVGDPTPWARHLVDALRPTQVVAVVDAMHKCEDIADWIEAIGGVDTLIVDNVAATVSPASILELGLPVSRMGDAPSTPARWAAALLDRLHASGPDPAGLDIAGHDSAGLDPAAGGSAGAEETGPIERPRVVIGCELAGSAPQERRWA